MTFIDEDLIFTLFTSLVTMFKGKVHFTLAILNTSLFQFTVWYRVVVIPVP